MTVVKVVLLVHKASLIWFVWVILFESILASVGFLVFYRMRGEKMGRWNFQTAEAKALLHNSWPLILSGLAIFVYMRISQVMLGSMLNEISVGIYAAALRISEIWYFIPSILLTSVYPRFVQMYIDDESEYTAKLTSIMSVFFWGSLLVAILVLFLSGRVINMLYGAAYSASANVLSVHIFTGVLVNMGVIFSQRYILKNQQKYFLWGTVFGAVVNVVFNLLLIPHYGAVGSAIATLFSQIGAPLFIAILFDRSVGRIYLNAVLWPVRLIYASK
jgi:PST family polysaccharide transporter